MTEKILIFTTGLAGRAIYRKFKNEDINILGFVDNNSSLSSYDNKKVFSFNDIKNLAFDRIAFGGIWSKDIKKQLLEANININKFWVFSDEELSFISEDRIKQTDEVVKNLSELLKSLNIKYIIDGSSLLSLFRKNDLAVVSDVDFVLINEEEINILYKALVNHELSKNYNIQVYKYKANKIFEKEGKIDKIVITSKTKSLNSEGIIIDINKFYSYKDSYLLSFDDDSYFIFKQNLLEEERKIQYKDIYLNIPFKAEEYLKCVYGDNWIKPSLNWSKNDYKNLINEEEINRI